MKHAPASADPVATRVARRWAFASLAGITLAALLCMSGLLQLLSPAIAALLVISCGWATTIALAPWKHMRCLAIDLRPEIAQLNEKITAVMDGDRSEPLASLLVDRDDELGRLSRNAHDLAVDALRHRQRTRMLHRQMNATIKSQTDRATAHLRREAGTDPLTNLLNRRGMEDWLNQKLDSAAPRHDITVIAIDLDLFKSVNDLLGHEAGDKCLVFLANLLRSTLRRDDCAVRLGGDEFLVIMPSLAVEHAAKVANRLQSLFAQMPWTARKPSRPSLTFGIAKGVVHNVQDFAVLLRRADSHLYHRKQSGRASESRPGEQHRAA